ncbi:hypothetical protein [Streptomyces sp. NPDC006012]|uniref:hypothetical protein n=1 Tax=Streptomyces sp. NPDC006012 TaxID=3364739 RepID=UPI0036BB9066
MGHLDIPDLGGPARDDDEIEEYQRTRHIAEEAEEAWLNRLADEAESEGSEGVDDSVSLEEMAALLRVRQN